MIDDYPLAEPAGPGVVLRLAAAAARHALPTLSLPTLTLPTLRRAVAA